eukprot:scaffold47815_cov110-Attheya_sp.AAC.1
MMTTPRRHARLGIAMRANLVIILLLLLNELMRASKLSESLKPASPQYSLKLTEANHHSRRTSHEANANESSYAATPTSYNQPQSYQERPSNSSRTAASTPPTASSMVTATAIATSNFSQSKHNKSVVLQSATKAVNLSQESPSNFTQYYYLHIPKVGGYSIHGMLSGNGAWVFNSGMGRHTSGFDSLARKNPTRRIFMTEGIGFNQNRPPHNLVMLRNPATHVVSQYFHCTESTDHTKARHRMPSVSSNDSNTSGLLQWLRHWERIRQSTSVQQQKSTHGAQKHWNDKELSCYNPINLQSWLIGYPQDKEEFESWFDVIGIQSQFHRSFCLMITKTLSHVPAICNCSSTTTTRRAEEAQHGRQSAYNDHGVKHHGDSFQPTEEEVELIRNLTGYDQKLYRHAEEIFEEQVTAMEQHYGVKFCTS